MRKSSTKPAPNPPTAAELKKADAKAAQMKRSVLSSDTIATIKNVGVATGLLPADAARIPTLDDMNEDGTPRADDAHKTVTADRCNGHAGPYCKLLARFLAQEVNERRRGLTAVTMVHRVWLQNGFHCGVAYVAKKGAPFTMLEFCPWCGANIRAVFPKKPGSGGVGKGAPK